MEASPSPWSALLPGPTLSAPYPAAGHIRHVCQSPSKLGHDISLLVLKACVCSPLVPDSAEGNEQLCWLTLKLVFMQAAPLVACSFRGGRSW